MDLEQVLSQYIERYRLRDISQKWRREALKASVAVTEAKRMAYLTGDSDETKIWVAVERQNLCNQHAEALEALLK